MAPSPRMVEAAQWVADQYAPRTSPGNRQIRDAFMAWWAAEDGWDWPTNSRNNPGNLRPSGDDTGAVGVTGQGAFASWRPVNFYVYRNPGAGVAMMVQRVNRSAHYPGIRAAIARAIAGTGDAVGIVRAVGSSPWGTNTPTMLATLVVARRVHASPTGTGWATVNPIGAGGSTGPPNPQGIPASYPGGTTTLAAYAGIDPARSDNLWDVVQELVILNTGKPDRPPYGGKFAKQEIAKGITGQALIDDANAFTQYLVNKGQMLSNVVGIPTAPITGTGIPAGQITFPINTDGTPDMAAIKADPASKVQLPGPADIANAIASLPAALGDAAVHVGWFLAIVAMIAVGLYLVATSR